MRTNETIIVCLKKLNKKNKKNKKNKNLSVCCVCLTFELLDMSKSRWDREKIGEWNDPWSDMTPDC